jgi:cardiolipin synthase A/B
MMKSTIVALLIALAGCSNGPTQHPYRIEHEYSVHDPQFRRTMGNLLGPAIIGGNSVTTLLNGEQMFPAMLEAIQSAKKTINIETYVYSAGDVGKKFADALEERARAGVQVRVMVDGVGAAGATKYAKQLKRAGAQVVQYHPLHWWALTAAQHRNNRTHRKLLIVDGQLGFIGGAGVADEWLGNADSKKHWRDTHYKVRGPIVAQLQSAFVDNWMETTGEVLEGDDHFPQLADAGEHPAQVFKSSPDGGSESMALLYLLSIAAAEKNIRLASAYFVPDALSIRALADAAKRGVKVQIIVPGKNIDVKIVRPASRARWGELLRAGVEIYEYQPTMYHVKQMIVDDLWTSIGSANLDNLSFRLNDEANLNVMDAAFAREQIQIFEDDLGKSKQITYEQWKTRPLPEKFMEGFATMFGFML